MISHSFVFLNLRQLSTKVDVPDSEKIFIILRDIAAQQGISWWTSKCIQKSWAVERHHLKTRKCTSSISMGKITKYTKSESLRSIYKKSCCKLPNKSRHFSTMCTHFIDIVKTIQKVVYSIQMGKPFIDKEDYLYNSYCSWTLAMFNYE